MENNLQAPNKPPDINLQVPAQFQYLPAIGHFSKAVFTRHKKLQNRNDQLAYNLELIIYEACSNVIRHAYPEGDFGKLWLKVWFQEAKVIIQVIDFGPGFNPEEVPVPDFNTPKESGMGLYIIKRAVELFHYTRSEEAQANILHLEKSL